jgi:hypothetical protein
MPINPFSPTAIHSTLSDAIKQLPPQAKGGIFIDGTRQVDGKTAATITLVTRIGEHVMISAASAWDGKHVEGKVAGQVIW